MSHGGSGRHAVVPHRWSASGAWPGGRVHSVWVHVSFFKSFAHVAYVRPCSTSPLPLNPILQTQRLGMGGRRCGRAARHNGCARPRETEGEHRGMGPGAMPVSDRDIPVQPQNDCESCAIQPPAGSRSFAQTNADSNDRGSYVSHGRSVIPHKFYTL